MKDKKVIAVVVVCILAIVFLGVFYCIKKGVKNTPVKLLDDSDEWLQAGFINREVISNIGDPYIVEENDTYYITATGEGRAYDIYSSKDLIQWNKEGKIFEANPNEGWVRASLWQPQIVPGEDGLYYLYYCGTNDNGSLRIGVAKSEVITGPYEDVYDHPLMELGYATIDPFFYRDDDGRMYLFYSRDCSENILGTVHTSQLYGIEMVDYTHIKADAHPVLLVTPEQDWELVTGDYQWNEGPHVLKRDGVYYLFYSGGCYADSSYSMGYAISTSPLGPYTKYENNPIIVSTEDVSGPGNNSFFFSRDGKELYNCYHTHTIKMVGGGNRKVTFDRCGYRIDGSFYMNGPTTTYQAPISGFGALKKIDDISDLSYMVLKNKKPVVSDAVDMARELDTPGAEQYLKDRLYSLVDGENLNSCNEGLYEWTCRANHMQEIDDDILPVAVGFQIKLSKKSRIDCIYLYGTKRQEYTPVSLSIIFDNGIRLGSIEEQIKIPTSQQEPVVLSFEPVETTTVTVIVEDFGEAKGFALSDIALYQKIR